ncbi:MAG: type III pantothenate kinase [Desulfovibrio sp.]|nr:MAG: type III pantothenate kinase [Desulfovibrio sp.]
MQPIILLFDVGNTTIKIALAEAGESAKPFTCYRLPTTQVDTADSLGLKLLEMVRHAGRDPQDVTACVACSVAPFANPILTSACKRYFSCAIRFAPEDIPVPLDNRYERPQEVGADRLVTAYAATQLYPGPVHIVVDFGTATTFDCVTGNDYLGGLICPGVLSSAKALASQTAKLPQVRLDPEEGQEELIIGRSTAQSLNQGLLFGFAAMVDGLVDRLSGQLAKPGEAVHVTATGGFSEKMGRVCERIDKVCPNLLPQGLLRLYTAHKDSGRV